MLRTEKINAAPSSTGPRCEIWPEPHAKLLTSTGCCSLISSWWGECLPARWWCHTGAFFVPKRSEKLDLARPFKWSELKLSEKSFSFQISPARFQPRDWDPKRHRTTALKGPQTFSLRGLKRCHTGSSLVETLALERREEVQEGWIGFA